MLSKAIKVEKMIADSFLNESTKGNYLQAYQQRLRRLAKKKDI